MMFDGKAFGEEVVGIMQDYVERQLAPLRSENESLRERIKALEDRPEPETDFAPVFKSVGEMLEAEFAKLPQPEPAKEVDMEQVAALVCDAVAALPPAQDGKSVEVEDVAPLIAAEVGKAVAAIPAPKDGEPGKNGRGVKDLLIDREGQLVATMDDGEMKTLGPVVGRDGKPGENGHDGFSLDDFDCQPVDERTIKLMFTRGEVMHSFELEFPVIIDRGVYKEGESYVRGDAVTWGGSLWIAQAETKAKPDGPDSGWRLAVKKGRDGKDAKNG
jgi:hypothetical protein